MRGNEVPQWWGISQQEEAIRMARVHENTLRRIGGLIEEEMREAGLIDRDTFVVVDMGSKTYGRAYRLYTKNLNGGGYSDAPLHLGDGYLGQTSGEAAHAMRLILRTLTAVRYAK